MTTERKPRTKGAHLEVEDTTKARAAAVALGPRAAAFLEWLYTNGARASEPGLAQLSDIDLYAGTVQLMHLKGGQAPKPMPMSERCRAALRAWLEVRPQHMVNSTQQKDRKSTRLNSSHSGLSRMPSSA